jgi:dTMP kinase
MKPGKFIVLEGIDGTGKSTQSKLLASYLKSKNIDCLLTFEPGDSELGKKLREMIFSGLANPVTESYLFCADRAEHVRKVIRPVIEKGLWVISDRFVLSSIAYQGYGKNLDPNWIKMINEKAIDGLTPDLTILLDAPVELGLSRAKRDNHFENNGLLEKVREGFLLEAKKNPDIIKIVDATKSIGEIASDIEAITQKILEV